MTPTRGEHPRAFGFPKDRIAAGTRIHRAACSGKYLALGMSLGDVLAACTTRPAEAIGLAGVIGTLAPQAAADIVILSIVEQELLFYDCHDRCLNGDRLLVPQMTIKNGDIVFRQVTFNREAGR